MKISAPLDLATAFKQAGDRVNNAVAQTDTAIAEYNKTAPDALQVFNPVQELPTERNQFANYTDEELNVGGLTGAYRNTVNVLATGASGVARGVVGTGQLLAEGAGNTAANSLTPTEQAAYKAINAAASFEAGYKTAPVGYKQQVFAKEYLAGLSKEADDIKRNVYLPRAEREARLADIQTKADAGVPEIEAYLQQTNVSGSTIAQRIARSQNAYAVSAGLDQVKTDLRNSTNREGQQIRQEKLDEYVAANKLDDDASILDTAKNWAGYAAVAADETLNPGTLALDIADSAGFLLGGAQRTVVGKTLGKVSQGNLVLDALGVAGGAAQAQRQEGNKIGLSGSDIAEVVGGTAAYYALNKLSSDNTARAIAGVSPTLGASSLATKSLLGEALARAGKVATLGSTSVAHVGRTGGIEGIAEGLQTIAEDNLAKGNLDVDPYAVISATVQGGVMGGALASPAAVGQLLSSGKGKAQATQAQIDGTIDDNIDIKNDATYNPDLAVVKIANQTIGVEDQDILAAHFADAQAVEAKANEHLIDAQDRFKDLNVGLPERIAELQDTIDTNTDLLTQVPVDIIPQVQANVDQAQAELTQLTSSRGAKIHESNIKAAQAKLETIEKMVKSTSAQVTAFGRNIQAKADRAAAQEEEAKVDGIDLSTDEVAQRAVDQIGKQGKGDFQLDDSPEILHAKQDPRFNVQVNEDGDSYIAGVQTTDGYVGEKPVKAKAPVDLTETKKQIFTNPNSMAFDDIQSFIDNPDAPIDDNERNALREFSAARQALQSRQNTSSVSQAVLKGADGFKGLNDYQSGISAAINSGNKKLAAQLTAQLTKFATSQNKKAALARELYDAAVKKGTREKTRMVYTLQGDWVKDTGQFKNINRETNGALDIHKGSLNLIQAIEFDSANINKTVAAFTTITKDAVADPSTAVPVKVQQAQVAQTKLATNRQINTSKQVLPYEANSTYNTIRGVTVADPKAPSDRNIADVSTAVLGQALPKQQDFQFTPNESGDAAKFANTEMTLASYANKMISNSQVTSDSRGTTVVDQLKEHFGDQLNSNDFTADDVVYVSEPYNTKVTPETLSQVSAAIEAGATILMPPTFTQYGLSRSKRLNTQLKALRDISQVLREGGYSDYAGIGVWVKDSSKQAPAATPKPTATKAPVAPQPAPVAKPAAPVQPKAEPEVEVKPARTIQDELDDLNQSMQEEQAAETKAEPVVEAKPVLTEEDKLMAGSWDDAYAEMYQLQKISSEDRTVEQDQRIELINKLLPLMYAQEKAADEKRLKDSKRLQLSVSTKTVVDTTQPKVGNVYTNNLYSVDDYLDLLLSKGVSEANQKIVDLIHSIKLSRPDVQIVVYGKNPKTPIQNGYVKQIHDYLKKNNKWRVVGSGGVNGVYMPEHNTIGLYPTKDTREGLVTLAHELYHAASLEALHLIDSTPGLDVAKQNILNLMNTVKGTLTAKISKAGLTSKAHYIDYSLTNMHEFFAVSGTDPAVIKFLRTIAVSGEKSTNILSKLNSIVGTVMGIPTKELNVYDKLMDEFAKLVELNTLITKGDITGVFTHIAEVLHVDLDHTSSKAISTYIDDNYANTVESSSDKPQDNVTPEAKPVTEMTDQEIQTELDASSTANTDVNEDLITERDIALYNEQQVRDNVVEPVTAVAQDNSVPVEQPTEVVAEDAPIAKPNVVPISEQEFEDIQDSLSKLANKPLSVKAEGRLDVLNNTEEDITAEKAKDWVDQNLVTAGMNQQGEVKGKGNPLLTVPNLLRKLSGKSAQEIAITLQPYLHEELTMAQINLIQKFIAFAVPFNARLSKMVKADNPKFYHKNFVKFLLSPKTKQLDENTLTAASLAVFNWVNDNRGTGTKDPETLRQLLDIPEDMPFPDAAYAYARIGDLSATIATALGTKITTALALQMNPDAPTDRMAKLQQSIGTLALDALKAGALVEVTQMSRLDQLGVMSKAMSEEAFRKFELQMIAEATNGEVTQTLDELDETQRAAVEKKLGFSTVQYVRVARTSDKPDSKPVPYAQGIIDAFKGTKGILGDLFGMDSLHTTPRLKPAKFTQTKIKGTDQRVPSALRKRIEKSNKTPMTLRADIVSVLRELYYNNPEGLKALLQIKDEDYLNTLSINKRKGLEAKWAAQLEGVKDALDYIDTLEKDKDGNYPDLFLEQVVYINQRIGYASTALNPQTNKVHRGMLGLKSAIATITPTKGGYNADHLIRSVDNPKGKLTLEDKFMMSIAAGMEGIKVLVPGYGSVTKQTVDKIDPRDFLPEFAKQINAPYMREYTAAMSALMEGTATPADIALVAEAVDKFDSDELGMSALMQLAAYHKGEPFTTSLGLDSDGTTNGMIIANLANGTLTAKMANQGGLFTEISGFTNFFQTKKEGIEDYYETIATVMNKSFHQLMTLGSNEFFDAVHTSIMNIESELFKRSFAKTLATPFNYGAGIARIKAAIAAAVLGKVYDKFEKIAKQYRAGDKQAAVGKIQDLEDQINSLIVIHNVMGHNKDFIDYVKQLHTYDGKLDEGEYERALWGALVARTNATIKPNVFGAIDIGKFDIQNEGHQKGLLLDMVKKLDMEVDPKNNIHTKKGFNAIMYQVIYKTGTRHFKEVKGITLPTNPEELLNYTLGFREQSAFLSAVGKTLGTTAGFAIVKQAAAYIKARDINAASQEAAFVMHDILLKNATNDLIQREVAAGNIPTDKNGNPLEGLSKLQQDEINKQVEDKLAIIPTAASTSPESEPEDKLTGGLRSVKQDTIYTKTPGNTQRLVFARPNGEGNTSSEVGIARKVETSPGVSTSAQQVQAIDSNISSTVGAAVKSINLHDANQFAFADFELGTKEQNRAFFYSMMQYSLPVSIAQAMYAPLVGIVKGFIASNVDKDNRNGLPDGYITTEDTDRISVSPSELDKSLESMRALMQKVLQSGEATFAQLDSYIQYAYQAELSKLRTMRDFTSIHQYAGADGEWSVDQETLDALDAQIKKVEAEYTAAVVQWDATLTAINVAVEKSYVEDNTAKQAQAEQSIELDYAVPKDRKEHWNTPIGNISPDNLEQDLLKGMERGIRAAGLRQMVYIFNSMLPYMKDVKFAVSTDLPADVIARYDNASNTILWNKHNLLKVTPATVMHEMMHAATSQILNLGRLNKLTSPAAKKAYKDLLKLIDELKSHESLLGTEYAFTDEHEFIAEAYSNLDFQAKLLQIRVNNNQRVPTSAWKKLLNILSQVFFQSEKEFNTSALAAVIKLTSKLTTETNVQQTTDSVLAQFVNPNMVAHVNGLSASELLDQVSSQSVSDSFMAHLRSVFSETVEPLQEAIGLPTLLADSSTQPNDVLMQHTIQSGKAPYVSSMRDAGFLLSSEEAYAVESIEAAAFAALEAKSDTLAFKELFKTFEAAKEHLEAFDFHYGDWNQADDTQRKIAQAKYDLIFGASDNHYLSRFIALTLGSEEINKKLSIIPQAKESTEEVGVFKNILNAFSSMVDRFSGSIVGVRTSDVVAERVNTLLEQLSSIELRKRSELQDKMMQGITDVTNVGDNILGTRSLLARVGDKLPDNIILQTILAPGKLDDIGKSIKQLRDYNNPNEPLGVLAEAFREGTTADKVQRRFELFARAATVMQRTRKEIIASTKKGLMNTFSEKGKYLEKRHHEAISYGLLRTDVQSIMDHYGIDRIKALYSNNAFRNKEIQDLERTILKDKNGNEFIHRTRDLAYNMIKQDTRIAQAKNAQQIASRVTVVKNPTIIPNDAQIVRDIDRLATLYAIGEVKPEQRKLIVEMMVKEEKTGAIGYVINSHGVITADARTKLFSGNPLNMVKGYVPEITNPHKEFQVGANTPENIADMKLRGFNLHSTVKPHPQDPVEKEWALFISPDGGQQRYVTGQVSLSTTHRKGTQAVGQADPKALSHVDNYTRSRALHTYKGDPLKYDPATAERGMVPAIDTQGNVIAYGYEMQAATRDALLERNNDFSDILGQYAGQIQDRVDSPKHNNEIMKALHEDFTDNYARNPHAYVDMGTRSTHPRLREIWAMLPQDTRFHAEELFGKGKPIYVRNDLITPVFGFNKISIGTMFDKHSGDRNLAEAITIAGFQMFFKDDARLSAIRTQRGVMEAIGLLKDLIVIRNVTTMLYNLQANAMILTAFGINPIDMVKGIKTAIQGALVYTKYNALLLDAQQRLLAGDGDAKTHQENIIKYSDILDRNPVKDFIAAGMLSTIVEDIGAEDNHYTYLSVQQRKMKKFTDKVPNSIKTTFAYVAVSPETPMHKFLTNATSFSDFAAKYVLYTHLTTKAKEKKTPAEAMDIASDMFINYDIPTSRELQFMNDIGILMFTKYNIRIQKALVYLIRNHAGNVLVQGTVLGMLANLPSAMESFMPFHIGNPFKPSILALPGALDEPLPIKLMGSLFGG